MHSHVNKYWDTDKDWETDQGLTVNNNNNNNKCDFNLKNIRAVWLFPVDQICDFYSLSKIWSTGNSSAGRTLIFKS